MTDLTSHPQIIDTTTAPGRYVHVHVLRPVVGVNLNADEDGAPKSIPLSGTKRMRVSSQAQKRAMRIWTHTLLDEANTAGRTRMMPKETMEVLVETYDRDSEDALNTVIAVLTSMGGKGGFTISTDAPMQTSETAFVPHGAPARLAATINDAWDDLDDARDAVQAVRDEAMAAALEAGERKRGRRSKAEKKAVAIPAQTLPTSLAKKAQAAFAPGTCAELAVYGRMLTALPEGTIDAAGSVADSYTVDPVSEVRDTWSIKDDWQDGGVFGAAHYATGRDARILGSGTLYQWACLDREQVRANLAPAYTDSDALEAACADAERLFVSSAIWALPTSKARSTGSATPPLLGIAATTDTWTGTVPCFTTPVTDPDTATAAVERLTGYLSAMHTYLPFLGGKAVWLPHTPTPAPALPDTITI